MYIFLYCSESLHDGHNSVLKGSHALDHRIRKRVLDNDVCAAAVLEKDVDMEMDMDMEIDMSDSVSDLAGGSTFIEETALDFPDDASRVSSELQHELN